MDRRTYLGLDVGTSSVKALLVDESQQILGEATSALDVSRPHPLWSEQNPDDWMEAVEAAVQTLRRRHPEFAGLAGVGLSGQMHGATFLDGAGRPIRPAILWNDGRAFAE
jgi:xylulokinase